MSASPAPSISNRASANEHADPKVQHSFEGDVKILNGTFDSRMEIRRLLANVQQILQKSEGQPVQVAAEVKFRVLATDAKEHTYTVTVNNDNFDSAAFAKPNGVPRGTPKVASAVASSPVANGQPSAISRRGSTAAAQDDDDDIIEVRPSKKARTDAGDGVAFTSRTKDTDGLLREALAVLKQRNSNEALEFMKQWHTEWVKQGGWLFDMLNRAEKSTKDNHVATQSRITSAQDVLGQSMNAASASAMTELNNTSKLVPWLEHCRKTAADKVQAREEKWRTSSATFHDQSRRDREKAEKKLGDELQRQRALLVKIAEANGVDVDDEDDKDDGHGDREGSLGAQLTAELNMEAKRAENIVQLREDGKPREIISLDDDEPARGKWEE